MSFYTFDVDNNQIFRLDGNVGIGTTNPGEKLDIVGNIKVRNSGSIFIGDSITDSLRMHHLSDGNSYIDYNSDQNLYFRKTTAGTNTDVLTLDNNGNVGIGTDNPRCELDVSGEIYASSTITGNLTGNVTGSSGSCTGNAATVTNGVYTSGDQTIGGVKTFSDDIIANSNVGIGTSSASEKLEVDGSIRIHTNNNLYIGNSITDSLRFQHTSTGHNYIDYNTSQGIYFRTTTLNGIATDVNNVMSLNGNGNVGIGTNNPSATTNGSSGIAHPRADRPTLEIRGDLFMNDYLEDGSKRHGARLFFDSGFDVNGSNHDIKIDLYNRDGDYGFGVEGGTTTYYAARYHKFYYNKTVGFTTTKEVVMSTKDGNLGIGTTDPQSQLHTYVETGNSHFMQQSDTNKMSIITSNTDTPHPYSVIRPENIIGDDKMLMIGNGTLVGVSGNNNYSWNKVIFDSPTQVGIGTTNPGYPLEVKEAGEDYSITSGFAFWHDMTSNNTDVFNYDSATYSAGSTNPDTTPATSILAHGAIVSKHGFWADSDSRIKTNIIDINDDSALTTLRQIQPKIYEYKDKLSRGNHTVYGFIAQQIKELLPKAITLQSRPVPSIYEFGQVTSSSSDNFYDTITFTTFNTADLDTSSNTLIVVDDTSKRHSVNITAVIDSSSVRVDTDLSEWMGAVDASGNVTRNEVQTYEKVILDASNNVILENYDIEPIASMDASENVVGKMADLTGDNTIDSSGNYVDASGNTIATVNPDGHYIDASGNFFDTDGNLKDASGSLIGTYKAEWKNVIIHGTTTFAYGQNVDDFHVLQKEYIFTVATAALQEVDRQLQAEKAKVSVLESDLTAEKAKTATLETQMADLLARVTALESA